MAWISLSETARNAMLNSLTTLLDTGTLGTIKIYDGTPAGSPETAISGQVLLATLTFPDPSFGVAASGVITAGVIADGIAGNSGTATWARVANSGGAVVLDCGVGTTGQTINLSSTSITSGQSVGITDCTLTLANAV